MPLSTPLASALLLLGLAPLGSVAPGGPPQDSVPAPILPGTPSPSRSWGDLLARDAEISFTPRTADSARADLEVESLSVERRNAGLMALGSHRPPPLAEASRFESWIVEGDLRTRVAATLALGELGPRDPDRLVQLIDDPEREVAEAALLALLRSGRTGPVDAVANDPEHPHHAAAGALVKFYLDPSSSTESGAARALLELRFDAARRHGLVRNQAWRVLVMQDLTRNEAFLDRVVYSAAASIRQPAVRDHFLEIVIEGPLDGGDGSYVPLKGALAAIPAELDQLVATQIWLPPDDLAWHELLGEIDRLRLESLTGRLLEKAWVSVPELETYAAMLLARSGDPQGLPRLGLAIHSDDPLERARVAQGLSTSSDDEYVQLLDELRDDESAHVRAWALVASFLLGRVEAELELRDRFEPRGTFQPTPPVRDLEEDAAVMDALCGLSKLARARSILIDLFSGLEEPYRTQVAITLCGSGRTEARDVVRGVLRKSVPRGERGAALVGALAVDPTLEDLAMLRDLFPLEGEPEVNAVLARSLIETRDPAVLQVLKAALWREPFNRSCLAAALVMDVGGVGALRSEIQHAPPDISNRDRRRVGFALGEFGGLEQVEALADVLPSGDPALQGALLGALAARTH